MSYEDLAMCDKQLGRADLRQRRHDHVAARHPGVRLRLGERVSWRIDGERSARDLRYGTVVGLASEEVLMGRQFGETQGEPTGPDNPLVCVKDSAGVSWLLARSQLRSENDPAPGGDIVD